MKKQILLGFMMATAMQVNTIKPVPTVKDAWRAVMGTSDNDPRVQVIAYLGLFFTTYGLRKCAESKDQKQVSAMSTIKHWTKKFLYGGLALAGVGMILESHGLINAYDQLKVGLYNK